ncbi:MAG: cobyrinic acid a,c-diamide synthase [Chromatiales bacterium 21-64-14]|nr:MAG: cobyrinic acid a,c-diamide synthase [Chromatiales bacterium 21-64-14]HQU15646.1 cobyrinate a,c-diamide synthase [Gammaproteobacteria bacterium]
MAHVLISAAHKSSGKTTVSIGLCAALVARGRVVQPFKKGPDYIDPMWLGRAAARPCHNLDFYTMGTEEILVALARRSSGADVALIEGNKGLYDGLDLDGSNSNAALAKLCGAPVVLVIDARGMTRGIAPLILGYQAFDLQVRIAGVILNQLGGHRHESKLRAVIEHYTDVPVLGALHRDPTLAVTERHLGLMTSAEHTDADGQIARIADAVATQVDLERLLAVASTATFPGVNVAPLPAVRTRDVRVGIARDDAFGFYYPGDLEALERAGAELVFIDTLRDTRLPPLDALFIGGGFPENRMEALEANRSLRAAIRTHIEAGLPAYAECGGLMYLARTLSWSGRCYEMVGVIPGDIVMHQRPQGRGYVRLQETASAPWPSTAGAPMAREIRAHEFHYSSLENLEPPVTFAYRVLRGQGVDGKHDGIVYKNLLACYAHLRDVEDNRWTRRFVDFARSHRCSAAFRARDTTAIGESSLPPPAKGIRS